MKEKSTSELEKPQIEMIQLVKSNKKEKDILRI